MCFQSAQLQNHLHRHCQSVVNVICQPVLIVFHVIFVFFNFIEDNTFYLFNCSKERDTYGALGNFCSFMELIFTLLFCSSFVNSTCGDGCVIWDVTLAGVVLFIV